MPCPLAGARQLKAIHDAHLYVLDALGRAAAAGDRDAVGRIQSFIDMVLTDKTIPEDWQVMAFLAAGSAINRRWGCGCSRSPTPNDNPFIESAFSTVKRAPEYPGRFLDDTEALTYFARYFTWYDTEHYHSGIDYVTPQQAHEGLRQTIVDQRRKKKLSQRRRRREQNKKNTSTYPA